jgi:hypothetical protein
MLAMHYLRDIKIAWFMPKNILTPAFFFAFIFGVFAQQNYYSVKFPDDQTIVSCGGTADTIWPEITYYANCNFNVGISVKDQIFTLNNTGGCIKILRTWKLLWWCDYNPNWPGPLVIDNPGNTDIGPTVMADNINHGYFQYTQVIKIVDNAPPVYLDCPAGPVLFCDYTNNDPSQYGSRCEGPVDLKMKVTDVCSKTDLIISYRLYLDLDGNGSMETFQSSSTPGAWPIEKSIAGDTVSAKVVPPSGAGLPYGKHKIEWITNDRCGNEAICKYEFEVRDCKPPTIVCMNGLSINIMQTGMITLFDTDFLQYTIDNCTPANQIKIGIRKSGTGTGFPLNEHSVTFDCNEIGKQFVEIWATDAYGNADYCLTYVIVQDNFGACVPPGPVTGSIYTEQQFPLPGAKVVLKSNLSAIPQQYDVVTDQQGNYSFPSAPGTCNYSIDPSLDTLPGAGVNTLDLILTDMHLSGQAPLASPYRIIAADANRDGQISTQDLDAIGDLIIGATNHFPGNSAWRFVPANHIFANPVSPLMPLFPEKISTVCPLNSNSQPGFIAVKTGDVDDSVVPNTSTRGEGDPLFLQTSKKRFSAGETFQIQLSLPGASTVKGLQFTLSVNPAVLTIVEAGSELDGMRMNVDLEQNRLAGSWYTLASTEGDLTVLTLTMVAKQRGSLTGNLFLNANVAAPEAYDQQLVVHPLQLQLNDVQQRNEQDVTENGATNLAIMPNPSNGTFSASYYLADDLKLALVLTDVNGQMIRREEGFYSKGNHQLDFSVEKSGIYFLSVITEKGVSVQRVLVQKN